MKVAVPRETAPNERRVALVPEVIGKLTKAGIEVLVESGAGLGAASCSGRTSRTTRHARCGPADASGARRLCSTEAGPGT